jgi:hypothetical protein
MKFLHILAMILGLFIFSCNQENESPMPIDKMSNILTDIHLAEYYSQGLNMGEKRYTKNYDSLALYYKKIFQHHNISKEDFDATFDWLTAHPEIMDSVYGLVAANIEQMKSNVTPVENDKKRSRLNSKLVEPDNVDNKNSDENNDNK